MKFANTETHRARCSSCQVYKNSDTKGRMPTPAYRLISSTTVVVRRATRETLQTLDPGSILIPTSATDVAGMIEATCDGDRVRIFARDLDERSERVEAHEVDT